MGRKRVADSFEIIVARDERSKGASPSFNAARTGQDPSRSGNSRRIGQRATSEMEMGRGRPLLDPLATALCEDCRQEAQLLAGEQRALDLLWAPEVPAGYAGTHKLCPSCLDLCQKSGHHERRCVLVSAYLNLTTGGWATPASAALREDLRAVEPRWRGIAENILTSVIRRCLRPGTIPVPTSGGGGRQDTLVEIARTVGGCLGLVEVPAVARAKSGSTRSSVAQIRRRIAEKEYYVRTDLGGSWRGQP
jgi:hypothetical protein